MKQITYRIESTSPMLMNNIYSMQTAKNKPIRVKHDEWEKSEDMFKSRMYLENGKLVIPSRVWKGTLKEACRMSGIRQKGKRAGYKDLVQAILMIPNSMCLEQEVSEVTSELGFVGMNGTKKVERLWPKLEKWSGNLTILIADENQFEENVLTELLKFAGSFIGVGDYRPEFGRFIVTKVEDKNR